MPRYRRGTVEAVTIDPLALTEDVNKANDRLLATVAGLSEAALAGPSLLPGWSRGHVLSHLARNAEAMCNLLTWARTGVVTLPYPSPQARADAIEAGAARSHAAQLADVGDTAARFSAEATSMPAQAWTVLLNERYGLAVTVVWRRLREVEVHHVDLDAGYRPQDWPEAFTHRLLHELVTNRPRSGDAAAAPAVALHVDGLNHPLQLGDGTPAVTVSGTGHAMAAWLSGRGDGTALAVEPAGTLPVLSDWM